MMIAITSTIGTAMYKYPSYLEPKLVVLVLILTRPPSPSVVQTDHARVRLYLPVNQS